MIYPVLTDPNPTLRAKAAPVPVAEITTPEFQKLIDDMIETMYASRGIGIAAPQIGVSKRVLIAQMGDHKPLALMNPEFTSKSLRKVLSEEGCLSIPGKYGTVKRHRKISARALDREGKKITITSDKLLGIIIQHEVDHLDGILFTDKAEEVFPITDREPRI